MSVDHRIPTDTGNEFELYNVFRSVFFQNGFASSSMQIAANFLVLSYQFSRKN